MSTAMPVAAEARRRPSRIQGPGVATIVFLVPAVAMATGIQRVVTGPFSLGAAVIAALGLLGVVSAAAVLLLRWIRPPTSAFMLRARRQRRPSADPPPVIHEWSDYDAIAPAMRLAAIAAEDSYFAFHRGFDWESIRGALRRNRTRQSRRGGGSTISQQVAKNLFLWPARSYLRKAIEAYFTVLIEGLWTKQRILEVYLNVAQFGPRVFGVGAASRVIMSKSAATLTPQEAALLAAVLPNPMQYDAGCPSPPVRLRQVLILDNMKRLARAYRDYL